MEDKKLNIYQKISKVMSEVEYLQKDDAISFGSTKYKAISEEKVTNTIRKALIKYGLVIIPVEQEHFRVDNLTTVNVKYKIINIDNPQEFEIAASSGTGVDTQDKGVGKAMTYCYKYLLLRLFAIPTGEDPDKISSNEWDDKLKEKAPTSADIKKTNKQINKQTSSLSDKQINEMYSIAKNKGFTEKQIQAAIKKSYNKDNPLCLTKNEYDELLSRLEKSNGGAKSA